MITLSLFRLETEQSITQQAQRGALTRLYERLERWQQNRAARVIKDNARLLAAPEEIWDFGSSQRPHDA